jgi:hypothetical protein
MMSLNSLIKFTELYRQQEVIFVISAGIGWIFFAFTGLG